MLGTRRLPISSAAWRVQGGASTTTTVWPAAWTPLDQRQYAERVSTRRELRRTRWVEAGWDCAFLISGLPLWAGAMVVLTVWTQPIRLILGSDDPSSAVRFTLSIVLVLTVLLAIAPFLTGWQRRRFRVVRGIEIREVETPRLFGSPLRRTLRSEALWRQGLYHLIAGPLIGAALVVLGFLAGLAVFVAVQLPKHVWHALDHLDLGDKFWGQVAYLLLTGTASFFAPQLLRALTRADEFAARRLLGPSETIVLAHRVQTLSASRAAAVEAADAERRRIERDLHDGAQQRLMSLAVHLGIARKTLKDVPPEAMAVIADAHEQVRQAMTEIRHLVRGLHPAVLDDRGLDAALSGVAARSAVPVRLSVAAIGPLSASVETVAYFVVSEALANVVKHSRASQASVEVTREDDRLLVRVRDNGIGGADAAGGSGLAGLAHRVASVDGRLRLTSPSGGPTTLTADLPCGV
ncbi:MAG: sensor histidine kinase [Catenulispora sp.]|nr:sensor histidine kinase [Catenulispora sp.]